MCRVLVLEFLIENTSIEEFKGKKVLEVGSKYVNGSVRPFIETFLRPKEYVGVDTESGKYVDLVFPAKKLLDYFGPESFDVVISTETVEHIQDWRTAINNMKEVLRSNGYIYITTVGMGFPYHGYPYDFWRYELEDMEKIFSDFEIIVLKRDVEHGVLLKAKKPFNWRPADLSNLTLYSMITGRRNFVFKLLQSKLKWLLPTNIINLIEKMRARVKRKGY